MRSGSSSSSADEESELSRIRMIPPIQNVPTHRNEHLENGNPTTSEVSETMSSESSVEDESDLSTSSEEEEGAEEGAENDTSSNKIFINGYFMYFDKISSNGTLIWRCEYNNTCKARLHGNIYTKEKENIHMHNHSVASDEEIKLYGLDPLTIVQDNIYGIDIVPDAQELRNVRERSATRMVGAQTLEEQNNTIPNTSAESSGAQDMTASDRPSMEEVDYNAIIAQHAPVSRELVQVNRSSSASLSGAHSNESPTMRIADHISTNPRVLFQESFDVPPELIRLFRPSIYKLPRTSDDPTTYMEFFLSMKDSYEEYRYTSIRINQRDEDHLTEALEQFCGQVCTETLYLFVSTRFRIILNQRMLRDWENNQFFLLDISPLDRWYLMCAGI